MQTRYIYTAKAEQIARDNNIQEYRKAGTAASFAYRRLENEPATRRAWLQAGYIEEAPEPVNFLTFTLQTTASNAMYKLFKANDIESESRYFQIYADIHSTGEMVPIDYRNIGHDDITGLNLFEIIEKKGE